jgi:hypothetical protein
MPTRPADHQEVTYAVIAPDSPLLNPNCKLQQFEKPVNCDSGNLPNEFPGLSTIKAVKSGRKTAGQHRRGRFSVLPPPMLASAPDRGRDYAGRTN